MAKVNYIIEHKSFMQLACQHMLSANEITLYNVLLMYFNELAINSEWEDGFVPIPNKHLLAMLPFSEAMFIRTREKLLSRGLGIFEFVSGNKRNEAPRYKMCYFSTKKKSVREEKIISIVVPGKNDVLETVEEAEQTQENTSVFEDVSEAVKVANSQEDNIDVKKSEEERKAEAVITVLEKGLGFKLSDVQKRTAKIWASRYKFDTDIYLRAAALSMSKQEPMQYLNKLLFNWDLQGVPETAKVVQYSTKRVSHQNYPQREYKEEDYNIWTPDIQDIVAVYN